jgi:hypothetical protein
VNGEFMEKREMSFVIFFECIKNRRREIGFGV